MRVLLVLASLAVVPVVLQACSSSDDAVPGPKDASTPDASDAGTTDTGATSPDTGVDAPVDTGVDANIPVRCTQAEFDAAKTQAGGDFTGDTGVDIGFPTDGTIQQYVQHCVKVKKGTDITIAGKFSSHPLEPNGGDLPTFIPSQSTDPPGGMITFKASTVGTYGFECNFHPSIMFGAIQVVP